MVLKQQERIDAQEIEIARLLAVEVAAKEICRDAYWKICNCEGRTDKKTGLASIAHKADCHVLVINPIGDANE